MERRLAHPAADAGPYTGLKFAARTYAAAPPILLIGDLAYSADMLMEDKVPGTGDAKLLRQSYAKVRQLKQMLPELVLVPSHDAAASEAFKSILASI